MNKQILDVVASVSIEKGVDKTIIFQALEEAIASATKKLCFSLNRRCKSIGDAYG